MWKPGLCYYYRSIHRWEHRRPQWLCSPLSTPLLSSCSCSQDGQQPFPPPTMTHAKAPTVWKTEGQAWHGVMPDASYIADSQGSVGIWKSNTSRQHFLGFFFCFFFLREWGQFPVKCVCLWGCCPAHDLGEFRDYIYCKRTGNKKFLWNSAYVHSHTKIINLLISQSSRKSARIKKMWFSNVRNKHIVLYRAGKLSCSTHKPLYTFHLARSM